MTTGATGQLGLALPVQGELSGTWGDTVNNGLTQYINIAIAGTLTLTNDGAVTLANTTGDASASNITSTLAGAGTVTAQFAVVRVSGTTGVKTVTGPSYSKSYIVDNASSYAVTFKASGQTGVSISPGEKVGVYYNGTDYVKIGGGGITYGAVKTSTYTAVANDGVQTNTTGGAFTVNLPASPSTGTQVFVVDSAGTWGTNNLTIGRNGSTIAGSATDLVCDISSVSIQCIYDGTTWDIFAQIGANDTAVVTLNGTQTLTNKTLTAPTITSPTVTGTGTIAAATVTLSSTLSVTGVSTLTAGAVIQGLTVGRGAGAVSTNTAVGASALAANTSGANNTAVGYLALQSVTTGPRNTAIGRNALNLLTTNNDNTAVGHASLENNTGGYNTAVGTQALQANTSASNNTAVGYQAGYTNSTGQYSVMVGQGAGYSIASNTITCVGAQAGYFTTGSQNQFFGNVAGYDVTSGANNTILGGYTGNGDGLDIRTASNYAVIADGVGNRLLSTANGYSLALDGGAVPKTGTGITFPATQSASSDANTLDDYEEGTWTPGMSASSSGTINLNYTYTAGKYTKVGRLVVCTASIYVSSVSSPSGNLYITGLPFTVVAPSSAGSSWQNGFTSSANNLVLRIDNSSTQVLVQGFSSGSVAAAAPWVQAGTEMNLTITYFV